MTQWIISGHPDNNFTDQTSLSQSVEKDLNKIFYQGQYYSYQMKHLPATLAFKKHNSPDMLTSRKMIEVPASHYSLPDFQRLMTLYFLRIKDSYTGDRVIDMGDSYKIYTDRHKSILQLKISQTSMIFTHQTSQVIISLQRGVLSVWYKNIAIDPIMKDLMYDIRLFCTRQVEKLFPCVDK